MIGYTTISLIVLTSTALVLNFVEGAKGNFILESWHSYEIETDRTYWLTFLNQFLFIAVLGLSTSGYDSLVVNYMMQISLQIAILKHRIRQVPKVPRDLQYEAIVSVVKTHNLVYGYFFINPNFIALLYYRINRF